LTFSPPHQSYTKLGARLLSQNDPAMELAVSITILFFG
jgi:hypothetical protein